MLPQQVQQDLRRELPSQLYRLDAKGRRCCLAKEETKQTLGRSPDNADSLLLSYANICTIKDIVVGRVKVPDI
jgi:hypothetical protein